MLSDLLSNDLLSIYLKDHFAGSTFGVELARRARDSNLGNDFGVFLSDLAQQIEEDRESLRQIMDALDVGPDEAKNAMGWAAEKFGRLKPNGRIRGYSPLSRLLELEGLQGGVGQSCRYGWCCSSSRPRSRAWTTRYSRRWSIEPSVSSTDFDSSWTRLRERRS